MTYTNIETTKSPFGNYRIGYTRSGAAVRIAGDSRTGYSLTYANSIHNDVAKRSGRYLGTCDRLSEVARLLERLD